MAHASRTLRVALAQQNYTVGDLDGNVARIRSAVAEARDRDADLLVCSELALSGYPPNDLLTREAFVDAQFDALDRVAAMTDDDLGVVVGFVDRNPEDEGKTLRNAVALCHGGDVVGHANKRLLPTYDVFDEARYFEPGTASPAHAFAGVDLGLSVCEDAWNQRDFWERPLYDADPVADLAGAGADLLVNVSASPFSLDKGAFRERLFGSHAASHGSWLVFVNQVGGNDELVFDGHSLVVAPDGEVVCRLPAFEEAVAVCEVPLDGDRPDGDPPLATTGGSHPEQARAALTLGLRDYVQKTGFERAIVGLSGGVDSSVTAALAAEALGPANVLGVAMPTRYTSDASETDARLLAENLGIEFPRLSIDDTFQAFLDHLAPVFRGREWDVTEENLQARIRGTTLMALSNKLGGLVLATGNKSELATGYCTLYGDMVGALAVLADCPKQLVYGVARAVNADREVIPGRVLERPPSAELRPDQTDQDTLPPYDVLDPILTGYVEEGRSADDLVAAGHDPATVERVLRMVHGSEYKRWQAAPVLKVTEKAFGIGWRFPLAASYDALHPD
ncbi:NAD+ synthase [Halobacteriaceae archaeon GCM10025711]